MDKPFSTSKWFPWIKLFERYRQSVLDLCGLYYACIVVKAKGMKANVDSKNSKDVMVFWNNDLWIMLHHKFICLLCVHHFSFFLNIDSPSFSSWCNQIIIIIFLWSFSNFLILMDFFFIGEPSVKQNCKPSMWGDPFQGNLKEKYLLL